MTKELHDMAKKLYEMRGAAKKKPADNTGAQRMASKKATVKKAEPQKAITSPAKKKAPVAAQPKNVPEKARKASMKKPVAKAAPAGNGGGKKPPSMKGSEVWDARDWELHENSQKPPKFKPKKQPGPMPEANLPEAAGEMEGVKDSTSKGKRRKALLAEHADDLGQNSFMELERDMPKGAMRAGEKMAVQEGEHLAAGAAEKSAMRMMKLKKLVKPSMGSLTGAAALGGITGLALQALMESVDAEEANPKEHDEMAMRAAKAQPMNPGRVAPRAQLASKLPSQVKTPSTRSDWDRDPNQNHEQAEMENSFARELKKWPR